MPVEVEIPVLKASRIGNSSSKSASRVSVDNPSAKDPLIECRSNLKAIKFSDVLSVTKVSHCSVLRDGISRWKAADDCWYIYVQAIYESNAGERSFDGIWLYKPSDTSCAKMKYPFPKELFFSENCTCNQARVEEEEVLEVVTDLAWPTIGTSSRSVYSADLS
jgi:DNA (cytosine-5)-methyltransferase 1